jgi:hypothetical protein
LVSSQGGAAHRRASTRLGVLAVLVLALVAGTVRGAATVAGAQTPPTSAPPAVPALPSSSATSAPTGSSTTTTTSPPVTGPARGAEPNGPQVASKDVQAEATDPNGEFTSVTPARILDTRDGTGGISGPFGSQQTSSIQIAGGGGVPSDGVGAVVLNVTATDTTANSFLTVFPSGTGRPSTSNLNWNAGTTIANLVTVRVGSNGRVSIFNSVGAVHVVVDVIGFYATPTGPSGSRFHPVGPSRYFDTRDTGTPFLQNQTRGFDVTGRNGVPDSGVTAVVMNVTVSGSTAGGYLAVFPGDVGAPPGTSNINFLAGTTIPNEVIVRVPSSGLVNFSNAFGATHVIADVVGWYDDNRITESGRFIALDPSRILDTRVFGGPIIGGTTRFVQVAGQGGVPSVGAGSVVMNVTATDPSETSFLTVHPDGTFPPTASNLNFVGGQTIPNLVTVKLGGPTGAARIYNRIGLVHVVADVAGYFTEVTFGFDACETPSISQMNTWKANSPYTSIGIYFGGGLRGCPNTALNNASWVNSVTAQGWRLIPTYVGAQAPCTGFSIRIDPNNAFARGVDAANDAANRAAIAGLPPGAPLYFDMEAYNNANASCSLAVKQFISGWVIRLHERGFAAGFYSSLNSGIADMAKAVNEGFPPLDAIWIAAWNDTPNIFGFGSVLPDNMWAFHQRIHQYRGGHDETYGGVTLNIDTNAVDGPLAP